MLLQQTKDLLNKLKLHGMLLALETQIENTELQSLSFEERLGLLVDAEINNRAQRRQNRLLQQAKLKYSSACPEDIDYTVNRGIDRQMMASLLNCHWIERYQNLIITGATGNGKTWLACSIAQQAIRKGFSVVYRRLTRLLEETEIARGDGSMLKLRTQLAKVSLLILDDWGVTPLHVRGRQDLLEIIEDCSGYTSILVTSQMPIAQWHDYLGEPGIADAILDRIIHNAHRIELKGESMRKLMAIDKGVTK